MKAAAPTANITLLFGLDRRFLVPWSVALLSATLASPKANLEVVTDDTQVLAMVSEYVNCLSSVTEIANVYIRLVTTPRFDGYGDLSKATYLRLEFTATTGRVLYLDSDTLTQKDLRTTLGSSFASGFWSVCDPVQAGRSVAPQGISYDNAEQYFNAGVMLIDAEEWHRLDYKSKTYDALDLKLDWRFCDQDALNMVLKSRWNRLPDHLNAFPVSDFQRADRLPPFPPWRYSLDELVHIEQSSSVLHFAGSMKPWRSGYPNGPNRSRYFDMLRESKAVASRSGALAELCNEIEEALSAA